MNFKPKNIMHLNKILGGAKIVFFIKIFGMSISYFSIYLISKNYGSEIVGIYSVSMSFLLILSMISSLGINISILRFVGEIKSKEYNLSYLYKYSTQFVIICSLLISFALFKLSPTISNYFFQNELYINALKLISLTIPFMAVLNIGIEFLIGIERFKKSEFLRSVLPSLIVVLAIYIYGIKISNNLLPVFSIGVGVILSSFLSIFFILSHLKKVSYFQEKKEKLIKRSKIIKTSFPMMITSVSALLLANISLIMCEYFLSSQEVGVYSVCWRISALVSIVMLVLNSISGPKFSELFWSNQLDDLQDTISESTRVVFYFSLLVSTFIIIFQKKIFSIFGGDFSGGSEIIFYFILSQLFYCFTCSNGVILNMIGKQKLNAILVSVVLFLTIILNIILIPKFGLKGAAITNLVSSVMLNFITSFIIQKKYNLKTYFVPKRLNFLN